MGNHPAWPSTKAKRVLDALLRIGWQIKRMRGGSHKVLERQGYPDYIFAFHDSDEIGPWMLARIAKHTGLMPEDLTTSDTETEFIVREMMAAERGIVNDYLMEFFYETSGTYPSGAISIDSFESSKHENCAIFVAATKDGLCGFAVLRWSNIEIGGFKDGGIQYVYIHPNCRRKRMGTKFADELIRILAQKGVATITVTVRESNPNAMLFWRQYFENDQTVKEDAVFHIDAKRKFPHLFNSKNANDGRPPRMIGESFEGQFQ